MTSLSLLAFRRRMLPKPLTNRPDPNPHGDELSHAAARRSPPELFEEAMREIFLRLRPGDPKALVRTAAGCRNWRRILSEAAFARDYRKFHGAPPMLGFLYEQLDELHDPFNWVYYKWVSRFVSTAASRPPASQDRRYWHVLDSRNGLVLFHTPHRRSADFVVCDLVTGYLWDIQANPNYDEIMRWELDEDDERLERVRCRATLVCASDRIDHLGGPFGIALVGSDEDGSAAHATVYSSETREWSGVIEVQTPDFYIEEAGHSAVVGDKVYVPCVESDSVVEYNMDEQTLSVIDAPDTNHRYPLYLMGVEDGMPLFVSVKKRKLYLWSMDVGPSGAVGWARHRIVDLEPSLPSDAISGLSDDSAVGFAEGVSLIFLRTSDGLYTIDLKSGQGNKVHARRYIEKVIPYMSFYTGA